MIEPGDAGNDCACTIAGHLLDIAGTGCATYQLAIPQTGAMSPTGRST